MDEGDQSVFEGLLLRIAELDNAFEQGEVDENTYHAQRNELKTRAKTMLLESEAEAMAVR